MSAKWLCSRAVDVGAVDPPVRETVGLNEIRRISHRSVGSLDPKRWIEEGDGLLAVSAKTRTDWIHDRETFRRTNRERKTGSPGPAPDWNLLTGRPRASMLLLGYAVEMYLKAGLVKAYQGCREEMFSRDVKKRFGHNLVGLAEEVAFAASDEYVRNLRLLEKMILVDARYPLFSDDGESYIDAVNQQTERIWNPANFEAFVELANRIRAHTRAINNDELNPASCWSRQVDDDGYLAFRVGGGLPPRITYRLSTAQKRKGETSADDMKALFSSQQFLQLKNCWGRAWLYEDDEKKTRRRAQPPA